MSNNKHIHEVKSKTTIDFAKHLIENALGEKETFDKIVIRFNYILENKNPFTEIKETTWRSLYSSLRGHVKHKWFYRTSILPYWLGTIWENECIEKGIKLDKEQVKNEQEKRDNEIIDSFIEGKTRGFKEKFKEIERICNIGIEQGCRGCEYKDFENTLEAIKGVINEQ